MTITVSCPSCATSFPVDPDKVPPAGVRAQCSSCPEIFDVNPPLKATPPAPSAKAPTISAPVARGTTVDLSDPLAGALADPPALEKTPVESGTVAPIAKDASEVEDFGNIDLASEKPEAAEAVPGEAASGAAAIQFGRRTAEDKAKSLARSLVSDLIAYNPDKHKDALAAGTLPEVFGDEIDKSLKEYQDQVEADVIAKGTFFNDALNSILAEDNSIFSLDN